MEELQEVLDEMKAMRAEILEIAEEDEAEVKAGKRNKGSDQALIDEGYALAEQLCDLFESLGATMEDEEAEEEGEDYEEEAAPMKAISLPPDGMKGIEVYQAADGSELAVLSGDGCKAVGAGDGWVSGYLVRFGGDGDLSQWRDIFDKTTDYGRHTKSDVWVHHRMLPGLGKRRLTNQAEIGMDDEGVFIKHLLELRSSYERKLYGMVQEDKLGWSSGTAPHLVERKALDGGKHAILDWPLGLDASYTPQPAGGLGVEARVGAMKSLLADAGIDLLNAIYDNQEAQEDNAARSDATKAAETDRARRLLLELELLQLEATTL